MYEYFGLNKIFYKIHKTESSFYIEVLAFQDFFVNSRIDDNQIVKRCG